MAIEDHRERRAIIRGATHTQKDPCEDHCPNRGNREREEELKDQLFAQEQLKDVQEQQDPDPGPDAQRCSKSGSPVKKLTKLHDPDHSSKIGDSNQ
jgi:hypothetical protein